MNVKLKGYSTYGAKNNLDATAEQIRLVHSCSYMIHKTRSEMQIQKQNI